MFKRPSISAILTYVVICTLLTLLFVAVYGPANAWGAHAPKAHELWLDAELSIPLVPEFIFLYFSLNLLTFLPLFVLTPREMRFLGLSFAAAILVAGMIFVVFPARTGWPRLARVERFDGLFQLLYAWDQNANTFPSLHISFSYLCVRILAGDKRLRPFLWPWFLLICASVVLTHQHHFIDILGGLLLGELCYRFVYLRARQQSLSQTPKTN